MLRRILSGVREIRYHPSNDPPKWAREIWGGRQTLSGVEVTPDNAMTQAAVWACVDIGGRTVGSLPLKVYERLPNGGKQPAQTHYLYNILHEEPNPEMTSYSFRAAMMTSLMLRGNALAEIALDAAGRVMALWPLRPDRYVIERRGDSLWYVYMLPDGRPVGLPAERVMHIRGLTTNGLNGVSPIEKMRETVGLAMAAEQYGASYFANDATPGGIVKNPNKKAMSDEAYRHFKESWEERHQGLENRNRIAILEEGFDYQQIGLSNQDSQFIETRRFSIEEIARIFHVPLHMIGELSRATFSNIEQQSLEFVRDFVLPWVVNIEQEMKRSLFLTREKQSHFVKFSLDGLLRGDTLTRYQALQIAWQNGVISADEWRALEDLNPLPENIGKQYYVPLNMIPADQAESYFESNDQPAARWLPKAHNEHRALADNRETRGRKSARERRRLMNAQRRVFRDVAERVLRRERNDILDAARKAFGKRDQQSFDLWLEQFYKDHRTFVTRQFSPSMSAYAQMVAGVAADEVGADEYDEARLDAFVRAYVQTYAARHSNMNESDVRRLVARAMEAAGEDEDPLPLIEDALDGWMDSRAGRIALAESVRENNAVARTVYAVAGIIALTWRNNGSACPYCSALDGKVVGIEEHFLSGDSEFAPDGAEPMRPGSDVSHPPAHEGCECMITAG